MALIPCPECKKIISEFAGKCPSCGYAIPESKVAEIKTNQQGQNAISVIGLSLCGLFVLYFCGLFSSPHSSTRSKPETSSPRKVVENSSWDGSVRQVKSWLKDNLKDPGSLEFVEWSPVVKLAKNQGFAVRAKYRAKNSFGGFVVENKVFSLDSSGNVEQVVDH